MRISSVQCQRMNQTQQRRQIVIRECSSPGMPSLGGTPLTKVAARITKVSPPEGSQERGTMDSSSRLDAVIPCRRTEISGDV
jgi:hypothetical protein